jgi:hypothetical protein
MHTVWQLPLAVAGLVALLLQLLWVGAATAATANRHAQSPQGACCVSHTTKRYQGLAGLSEGCCAEAHMPPGKGSPAHVLGGVNKSLDEECPQRGSTWHI